MDKKQQKPDTGDRTRQDHPNKTNGGNDRGGMKTSSPNEPTQTQKQPPDERQRRHEREGHNRP